MPRVQLIETNEILSKEDYCARHPTWSFASIFTPLGDAELLPDLPVVPQAVPMRSARRVLYTEGLLATVEGIIAGMTGEAGDLARIDWATALMVRRDDPVVVTLIPALGKTEAEIDAMFIVAAAL